MKIHSLLKFTILARRTVTLPPKLPYHTRKNIIYVLQIHTHAQLYIYDIKYISKNANIDHRKDDDVVTILVIMFTITMKTHI